MTHPSQSDPAAPHTEIDVAIVGAGPAGLMAAEVLSRAGVAVHVFDAMPSAGRKFLLAGKGGLNLTHAESLERFVTRYGAAQARIEPWLRVFGPQQLRDWVHGLGIDTPAARLAAAPAPPTGRWRAGALSHAAPLDWLGGN